MSEPESNRGDQRSTRDSAARRVVVVGSCATGKSTLVAALRAAGVDAYVCAQEHSEIPTLWKRGDPDFVVALEADLETVRRRRNAANWPEEIYRAQRRRLRNACSHADLVIDTARHDALESASLVLRVMGLRAPDRALSISPCSESDEFAR